MSTHKRTTTKPSGTPDDGPTLRAVPTVAVTPVRTDTQNHLWAAMKGRSDATTAQLAIAAGIGRSTAGKVLAEWAKDGTVTRKPGGVADGRRTPDRWAITTPDTTHPDGETNGANSTDQKSVTPGRPDRTDAPSVVATPVDDEPSNEATEDTGDTVSADQSRAIDMSATNEKDESAPDSALSGLAMTDTAPRRATADGNDDSRRGEPVPGAKSPRLQSGALRGLVEDYLRDRPADAFSPAAIGKALNRSAGAVNNALEKMVETGYAQLVQDTPKRFQVNASPESPTS